MSGSFSQEGLEARFQEISKRMQAIEAQLALVSQQAGIPYAPTSQAVPADVVELANAGKTMEAITRYRELTHASIADARQVILAI